MSHKIETAAAEREPLATDVLEHFERLEAMAQTYREQSPPDPVETQRALEPLVDLARSLRAEYAAYQEQFTPILDRVAVVDLDSLENFHGFYHISPLPSVARRIKRAIVAAIEDIDDILDQADAFARGERPDVRLWDIREIVPRLEEALRVLPSDIRLLPSRIGNLEMSQPVPTAKP